MTRLRVPHLTAIGTSHGFLSIRSPRKPLTGQWREGHLDKPQPWTGRWPQTGHGRSKASDPYGICTWEPQERPACPSEDTKSVSR